ncbi:PH domain-containing protein [Pengzhenrongella frigida]|uniref:PH domain-containing protein n=1 Tax=Pengzhenrongella frigida TaxID=1259133 RepID=UPI0013ED709B|nr:PH domain-containing protein [Cellulomonas sp. HLT2-17]
MPPPVTGHTVRPRSAIAAAVGWGLVTLGWSWFAVHDGGPVGLVRQVPGLVLAATLVYAVLVRPSVEVSPTGVALRNVVRDVMVPWAALAEVRTRYALTLVTTDGRRFTAWAAPASGRHTDARLTLREVQTLGLGPDEVLPTASASSASQSGAVAAWVRREWGRSVETDGAPLCPTGGAPQCPPGGAPLCPPGGAPVVRTRLARGVLVVAGVSAALVVMTALV